MAEIATNPTLAERLGEEPHPSCLLRKARDLVGCSEDRVGEWLLKCAVERGASHYARAFASDLPPDHAELSNEEIGVALCVGEHPYNSALIRAAAQLLSSPRTDVALLLKLAVDEGIEPVLRHIASVAGRYAPEVEPWAKLLERLPIRLSPPVDALPHWSRFVSQTGVTAFGGGPEIRWLGRCERAVA